MGRSKRNKKKSLSRVEIWKGMRKQPVPPGRIMRSRLRDIEDEEAEREIRDWLQRRHDDDA